MQLIPYLLFNGQCEEAFKFYEKVLGGKIEGIMKNGESPMAKDIPADQRNRVMHARLTFDKNTLMASDAPPERYHTPQGFSVSLNLTDRKKAEQIFNALAEGGTVVMPFQETFWSPGFGMITDRFATPWMINVEQASH